MGGSAVALSMAAFVAGMAPVMPRIPLKVAFLGVGALVWGASVVSLVLLPRAG